MIPTSRVLVRTALCALVVIGPGLFTVAAQQFPRHTDPIEVPLTAYIANLRTLAVTLGNDTVPFLLDTGGGFTVLTPEVARSAGCVPFGRVTGFRSSGGRLDLVFTPQRSHFRGVRSIRLLFRDARPAEPGATRAAPG